MKTLASSFTAAALVAALSNVSPVALPAQAQVQSQSQSQSQPQAQPQPQPQPQARSEAAVREQYLADRSDCQARYVGEALKTCLSEAGAAAQAARQGNLAHSDEDFRRNALARCTPLPPEQRQACRERIEGQGTVKGSVEGGGLYRELVTREVAPAPVVPGAALPDESSTPPPPSAAPSQAGPSQPAPRATRPAGAPTFTPVQPLLPGRSATPMPPPASGAASGPAAVAPLAPGGSLDISPPATPVLQLPPVETAPAANAERTR